MNFCRYCGSTNLPARRRYCDDDHRKRATRQRQSEAGKRRYALAVALRRSIERGQRRYRWRQIALGVNEAEHLAVVFRPKRKRRAFT